MNIEITNIHLNVIEADLRRLFTPFGEVSSVKIITDNYTKRPRGFAFVEMPDKDNAEKAIEQLNNTNLDAQPITVNEARPRTNSNESSGRKRY